MAETVQDIIGKGFKFEERVEVEKIYEFYHGSVAALVGVANWGPVNTPTKINGTFSTYFGTEINRDVVTKDFSGFTAARILKHAPVCYFTRITDGSDQKASKLLTRFATAATFVGKENVYGKNLKITEANNIYKTTINGTEYTVLLPLSSIAAPIISGSLPTSLFDINAKNYNVGDYFELYVDGILYQYIISSTNDIFCKLAGANAYDDSFFGGVPGSNVINYVDRLIYAIKTLIIKNNDINQIVRKIDNNKISINSIERGATSTIRINNFPIVFPTASSNTPLISTSTNTNINTIVDTINQIIASDGTVFINAKKTFETRSHTTGASSSLAILPIEPIDLSTYFTPILISGAGAFKDDPTSYWKQLTNGLIENLEFAANDVVVLPAAVNGTNATNASHTGSANLVGGYDWSVTNESFKIIVDGGTENVITLTNNCATIDDIITHLNTLLSGLNVTASKFVDGGNEYVTLTRDTAGDAYTFTLLPPDSGINALTTFGFTADTYVGSNATAGYALMHFATNTIAANNKCPLKKGTYVINVTVNGGAATNYNVTVSGSETWQQFVTTLNSLSPSFVVTIDSGNIRFTSSTTGASSSIIVNEGVGLSQAITMSYNSVNENITIATTTSCTSGHSVAQKFQIIDAYSKNEIYTNIQSVSGSIKLEIYKGSQLLKSKILSTTGTIREYFYALGSDGDYYVVFKPFNDNTNNAITLNNLYIGPYRVQRDNSLYSFLGITHSGGAYDYTYDPLTRPNNLFTGSDAILDLGTIRAKYTGSDGNLIKIIKSTSDNIETLSVYFGNLLLGIITNFSYIVDNVAFFGNQINNHSTISKYIEYIPPTIPMTEIPQLLDGEYQLSGGTSGIDGVVDSQYADALNAYKNMDIYDVDIIAVPGNSTKLVIEKLKEVCEYRKDCFAIVDPPEIVAGKPGGISAGGANTMILWHNGLLPDVLNYKLDSKYLVTYFPWVLLNTNSPINAQQWMPPSTVVIPKIIHMDIINGNKFGAVAGKNSTINDIIDLAYYLTEEEKGQIYDDKIGNNINPIVYTNRLGFFIDGQKTTQRERNAYNRIPTMRVGTYMKRKLFVIVPDYYYLPIIGTTKDAFKATIEKQIMEELVGANAIKSNYEIIIDASVNTPNIEADNGMVAVIVWSPTKYLEKLKVISFMKDQQVFVA